eukprot:GHVN01071481.1.p1 GENE.GHVN01071481.1~~GHVN01071481.1.p1  ORF type:complete len:848 (-),score=208.68 GHVN01071481.1:222-2765(-)
MGGIGGHMSGMSMEGDMGGMGGVGGGMGRMVNGVGDGMPLVLNMLTLNPIEAPVYQNLFMSVDPNGTGYVDAGTAAQFLQNSGLPRYVLHQIWAISDPNNLGMLDFESFCIACRLVAHCQNGMDPTPDIAVIEPPSLPNFEMGPSQGSEIDSVGGGGEIGGMGPGSEQGAWSDMMSVPGAPGGVSWTVTSGEKSKYTTVFNQSDANQDGYLEADEAKVVMESSGLPQDDLAQIWTISDKDGDGRLSLTEFIVAMKMISCRRKGAPIPSSLPAQLEQSTSNYDATQGGFDFRSDGGLGGGFDSAFERPPGEEEQKVKEDDVFVSGFDFDESKSDKKKGKKSEPTDVDDFSFSDRVERERGGRKSRSAPRMDNGPSDIRIVGSSPIAVLEGVIEADKKLARIIQRDIDEQDKELRELRQIRAELGGLIRSLKSEVEEQWEKKRELERMSTETKMEMEEVKEKRRKIELATLATERDSDHLRSDADFLREQIKAMSRDIENINQMGEDADKNRISAEKQSRQLDATRQNVLDSLKSEHQFVQRERREMEELKITLERLRRDKDASYSHTTRAMQSHPLPAPAPLAVSGAPSGRGADHYASEPSPYVSGPPTWSTQMLRSDQPVPRDSKGVRSGPTSTPNTSHSPHSPHSPHSTHSPHSHSTFHATHPLGRGMGWSGGSYYASDGGQSSTARNPPYWTSFGSTDPSSTRRGRYYNSNLGDDRGVDSIVKSRAGRQHERTSHVGSYREDREFENYRSRRPTDGKVSEVSDDRGDRGGRGGKGERGERGGPSERRREDQDRSSSRRKKGDHFEVTFGDEGEKPRRNKQSQSSLREGDDAHTPSFGNQSINLSN